MFGVNVCQGCGISSFAAPRSCQVVLTTASDITHKPRPMANMPQQIFAAPENAVWDF
jgi:hypothetical protein